MKTTDFITDKINRLPIGFVFTYDDLKIEVNKVDAVTKALGRLVKEGKIRKLSPGRFYKARTTDFGELKPDIYQVVKDLLEENGKILGYLTGYYTYNMLKMTTQVPSIIQIGSLELKKGLTRGIYKIRFIKQPNRITKENITLLQILDSVRNIKEIPDTTVDKACLILNSTIKKISPEDRSRFVKLALKYNPATRALTGAILENIADSNSVDSLYKSLNPSSSYSIGISDKVLPNKLKWNIL